MPAGNGLGAHLEGRALAHPPATEETLERAVRWALGSTLGEGASMTLLLLPRKRRPPPSYEAWLLHPAVRGVIALPKHCIHMDDPQAWVDAPPLQPPARRHPSHDMQMVVIANATAWQTYAQGDAAASLAAVLATPAPRPASGTPCPPPPGRT